MLRDFSTRCAEPELLDRPELVLTELPRNLRDIRRLNRWFGGTTLAVKVIRDCTRGLTKLSVLDVATGSADIPLAVLRDAERRSVAMSLVATDVSDAVLDEARIVVGQTPIELVAADARSLPFDEAAFDVCLCSLALHHFQPTQAAQVMREMWRVARHAIVVIDLYRSRPALAGTWLATRVLAGGRLTRHDGPLSVLRAYRPAELRDLAREAGLESVEIRRHAFFRQTLISFKPPKAGSLVAPIHG